MFQVSKHTRSLRRHLNVKNSPYLNQVFANSTFKGDDCFIWNSQELSFGPIASYKNSKQFQTWDWSYHFYSDIMNNHTEVSALKKDENIWWSANNKAKTIVKPNILHDENKKITLISQSHQDPERLFSSLGHISDLRFYYIDLKVRSILMLMKEPSISNDTSYVRKIDESIFSYLTLTMKLKSSYDIFHEEASRQAGQLLEKFTRAYIWTFYPYGNVSWDIDSNIGLTVKHSQEVKTLEVSKSQHKEEIIVLEENKNITQDKRRRSNHVSMLRRSYDDSPFFRSLILREIDKEWALDYSLSININIWDFIISIKLYPSLETQNFTLVVEPVYVPGRFLRGKSTLWQTEWIKEKMIEHF